MKGAGSPWFKGGYLHDKGYWVISVEGKKKLEHRHVMELHLGRELAAEEDVHHIDGDKLNNKIENLRIMSRSEHLKLHWGTGHYDLRGRKAA
ncbi:HNH endonuclease signature motif containing protein [Mycolicibacterium neoaurum]|uniref:HNH endonuclease signature motif containing protein n=1 Tax=Mycolicibacterium neoaurum TaxID=1795 RepID=UPI001F4D08EC|nr:HNH endonuclease signature motif containing protein [Mycolicibacterium neoaurum]